MQKIDLPFKWEFDLPAIVAVQFQIDLSQLIDESEECSEYPCFFINLSNGELLMVDDVISSGVAYRYQGVNNWLVEGKGWWIGYSDSDQEELIEMPNEKLASEMLNIFTKSNNQNIKKLIDDVCELGRNENLKNLSKVSGLYQKHIQNENAPSLG